MRDLTDKLQVLINQTNETAQDGVAGIKKPFCDVVKTLDETISEEEMATFFDNISTGSMAEEELGSLNVILFPDTDNSRGHVEVILNK